MTTDAATHQAWLRQTLGSSYKNFENLVLGRGERSPTTQKILQAQMPGFDGFRTGPRDPGGPFLPELLKVVQLIEGIPFKLFQALTAHELNCPHCGADVLRDTNAWWKRQAVQWNEAEYRFAERLLTVLLSATFVQHLFSGDRQDALSDIVSLAGPERSPFGHWIRQVMNEHRVQTYQGLADALPYGVVDERRLRKWSSGRSDLMPLSAGRQLIAGLRTEVALDKQLIAARVIAFVIDFLCATALDEEPDRGYVQSIVCERLRQLSTNARLAARVAHEPSAVLQAVKPDIDPASSRH